LSNIEAQQEQGHSKVAGSGVNEKKFQFKEQALKAIDFWKIEHKVLIHFP